MTEANDGKQTAVEAGDPQRLLAKVWMELNKRVIVAKESPEPGFDPITAPAGKLERFGLPARPDRIRNPVAFANWRRAMSPPLHFVPPEIMAGLAADLTKVFAVSPVRRQLQFRSGLTGAGEVSSNWSGAYVRNDPDEGYVLLQGTWVVPRPYPPPPSASGGDWLNGDYYSSAWIGFDGHDPGSLSLPQIGTAHRVQMPADTTDPGTLTVYTGAWWQWWLKDDPLDQQVDISPALLSVQPGDQIYAQLSLVNGGNVRFFIKNMSQGQVFPPYDVTPPTPTWPNSSRTVSVEGKTAAWVVERPTEPMTPDPRPFCDSGSVVFTGCNAQSARSTPTGIVFVDQQLQRARTMRMADWTPYKAGPNHQPGMDEPGIIVSSGELQGDDAVLVSYEGLSC